jgi:signal transduction histidine kinase
MKGLVARILALEAVVFILAAVLLPILVFQLPRASAVLYLALVFAGVLALSGLLIAWRIVRPLKRLIAAAESVSAAVSSERSLLPEEESVDEIGRLTRALNRMVRRLAERQRMLESNIAELTAQRRSLEAAHEALLRSERLASLGRLAAGVAHEVGNPLAALQGYLGLIGSAGTTAEQRADYLARSEAEVDRIHRLVRDLVDYARPRPPALGPVDLRTPIEAALNLAGAMPRFRGIRVERRYDEGLRQTLGDETRLLQVMLNLLLNAADAMDGRGILEVGARNGDGEPGWVEISVTDSGVGIPAENLAHIFEPFFTTKSAGAGTGLGLAISKSIVESLGGEIRAASEVGRGSTFTVRLPMVQAAARAAGEQLSPSGTAT